MIFSVSEIFMECLKLDEQKGQPAVTLLKLTIEVCNY